MGLEYLEAIQAVTTADVTLGEVLAARDEFRLLEALAMVKKTTSDGLDSVDAVLAEMGEVKPPREASACHRLMVDSMTTSRRALLKLSFGASVQYDKAYAQLHRQTQEQVPPDTASAWIEGRRLLREALGIWEGVVRETDRLMDLAGIRRSETQPR